jgi:hypothetical protein
MGNLVTRGCEEIDLADFPGFRLDANVCRRPSCRVNGILVVVQAPNHATFQNCFPIIFNRPFSPKCHPVSFARQAPNNGTNIFAISSRICPSEVRLRPNLSSLAGVFKVYRMGSDGEQPAFWQSNQDRSVAFDAIYETHDRARETSPLLRCARVIPSSLFANSKVAERFWRHTHRNRARERLSGK